MTTPRRIQIQRAVSSHAPVLIQWNRDQELTAEQAHRMAAVWRRATRVPLIILPRDVEATRP